MNEVDKLLDDAEKALQKEEKIKAEQSIKPYIIKKNNPLIKLKTLVLIFIIITLTVGFIYARYYYQAVPSESSSKQKPNKNGTPTPTLIPTKTQSNVDYNAVTVDNSFIIQYPSSWRIISKIPDAYKAIPFGSENWQEGKMFSDCGGPIIQNSNSDSSLIIVESQKEQSKLCWDNGDLSNLYFRQIQLGGKLENIKVYKWKLNSYQQDGVTIKTQWNGDILEQYTFTNRNNGYKVVFALYYQDGKDYTAELVYNQFLKSFRFLGQNEGKETTNWKSYTNNANNYQVGYPPNWVLLSSASTTADNAIYIREQPGESILHNVTIEVTGHADNNSLDSSVKSVQNLPDWSIKPDIQTSTINGENASILKGSSNGNWMEKIFILHKGKLYSITWVDTFDRTEDYIFNILLSTFIFLK